jgi:phage protein D
VRHESHAVERPQPAVGALGNTRAVRRKQFTDYWPKDGRSEVFDSDIAREIGQKVDNGKKRFPLTIRVDESARSKEASDHQVFQKNQYDIVFLLSRARRHGYVVAIEEFEKKGKQEKRLYFGPSEGAHAGQREKTFRLEWGKSLIQFNPTLTTAKQIGAVTVRGWDRKSKKPIEETVKWENIKINRDLGDIAQEFNQREEIVTDKPVYTKGQAKEIATKILKDQAKELVKGSGSTIGLPDLRAGRRALIDGLGARFSGMYYITDTTHTINDSGYQTSFNARREEEPRT